MSYHNIYLACVLVFFILAFFIRNIKTYVSVKKSIRGRSLKLTSSILLSTVIYIILFLKIFGVEHTLLNELVILQHHSIKGMGLFFVTFGFFIGLMALHAMQDSWRIGIKYDQKTELITNGIFKFSRNPYFFSYDLLFLGTIMIFPSWLLIILYVSLALTFHLMILEEEKYLEEIHQQEYFKYKRKTGRYFSLF